ncbi:MAG: Gfo/Idh/MocA family oxidoreductase [Chloroflexota bacterium]|nr:Gfo/Idh/MocA family oxidoreductase [Chloroflexota bacterium]
MSGPLGLALVSCVRHQKGYAPLFAAHPEAQIVVVTDEPDIPEWMHAVNQEFAEHYGVPYVRDVGRALDRPDVAMVSVCSEPTRHARLAMAAAMAGKHIWVDKPIATSLAEADELVAAVVAADVQLSYVHRLHAPAVRQARRRIEGGELGRLESLHLAFVSTGSVVSGAVEDFQLVVDKRLSGGGELMNFFGYPVDAARYLTGSEVTHVYASAGTYFFEPHRELGVEDFAVCILTLEDEVTATVVVGRSPAPNHPAGGDMTLRAHGTTGSLIVDENRPRVEIRAMPPAPASRTASSFANSMLMPLVEEFVASVRGEGRPLRSMHDARAIVAVIEAAYRSVASGQVEAIASR